MAEIHASQVAAMTTRRRIGDFLANPPEAIVLALCAVILLFRRAEAVTHPQFWAEDAYFFQRAYLVGWPAFVEPFAGYLHTILRAVAAVAVGIDPAHAPGLFVAGSAAVTLYVASRTLSERCPLPRLGGAFALAVVLVPDTYEVLLTVVNLQWVIGAAMVLLLISRDPRNGREWFHDLLAAATMGLTGPFCIMLSPLFAWRAWDRRTRASVTVASVVVACALIQGYLVHTDRPMEPPGPADHVGYRFILPAIGHRVGGSILMGALRSPETDQYLGTIHGVVTLAGVGYLAFMAGWLRRERILLGLAFFIILAASLWRTRYTLFEFFFPLSGGRYVYIPQLLAMWLLLVVASQRTPIGRIALALCAWALLVNIPILRAPAFADLHWSRYEPSIRAGEAVVVPVNPPGWIMPVAARRK